MERLENLLAEALSRVFGAPGRARVMGRRGRELAEHYRVDIVALSFSASFKTEDAIDALIVENSACRGVVSRSGRHFADRVVVCAGAWSGAIATCPSCTTPGAGR